MNTTALTHLVFVDFENVPNIDLALVTGRPVKVTLLIGKNQKKIDLSLVQQIHQQADRVALIEVGASGRNALDLTLACYLGQAVQQNPAIGFCIVSKDKDFDPLVAHLLAQGVVVSRHESFAALPFLSPPAISAAARPSAPASGPAQADRLQKLILSFQKNAAPRPKKKARLLALINNAHGGKLDAAGQEQVLDRLKDLQIVAIDAAGKVTYL